MASALFPPFLSGVLLSMVEVQSTAFSEDKVQVIDLSAALFLSSLVQPDLGAPSV